MPLKDGDTPRRKHHREVDGPQLKDDDKERERHRASRKLRPRSSTLDKSKLKSRAHDPDSAYIRRPSISSLQPVEGKSNMDGVPEMSRRVSLGDSKLSSYPAFSKEHSREAVRPSHGAVKSKISLAAPDTTEVERSQQPKSSRRKVSGSRVCTPPSPPLTADEGDLRRPKSTTGARNSSDSVHEGYRRSADLGSRPRTSQLRTEKSTSPRKASRGEDSDSSAKTAESSRAEARRYASGPNLHRDAVKRERDVSYRIPTRSSQQSSQIHSQSNSQATSVAADRSTSTPFTMPGRGATPPEVSKIDQSRSTTPPYRFAPQPSNIPLRPFPHPAVFSSEMAGPSPQSTSMIPPPPPPPVNLPDEPPRVDYLLLNGGLPYLLPKSLIPGSNQPPVQLYQQYTSPQIPPPNAANDAAQLFSPVMKRMDDLNKVLMKNGSIAVATGYRSVARRLLDRLEHVFARNISSEKCECVMCNTAPAQSMSADEADGVSWGEILEFVSGRRELPPWPPFNLDAESDGVGLSARVETPMQKLDPDVPEEFRQHYMRQNDKTKRSVQSWLETQHLNAPQSEPPTDVDDETLSFAMITRLEARRRPLFAAIIKGQYPSATSSRAPTPANTQSPERANMVLHLASTALQRLYRLPSCPRNPETTLYLVNNPHLHSMLATLAAVSPQEWDILVSGRFDGFLWSGAENSFPAGSLAASRPPTRGPTPLSPLRSTPYPFSTGGASAGISRGPTPFSVGGGSTTTSTTTGVPVQHDEETEIAVLFEIERAIYRDMEMLEDAFEALHQGAEGLRARLRSRAAGLTIAAQARRGSLASPSEGGPAGMWMGMHTPSSVRGMGTWEDEVFDDGRSELAPDDSASNISFARRRRGKERRTPGLDEEAGGTAAERRRRR